MKEGVETNEARNETRIKEALEREFSLENLRAYAKACEEIGVRLAEILEKEEDGVAILLPSRGAIPVFIGACFSLEKLGMLGRIDLPPLTCFDYIRGRIVSGGGTQIQRTPVLIFPFTSDVNFGDLVKDPEQKCGIIDHMRRFGARAVMDFFKPPGERNGLEYQLFLTFLEVVEGRRKIIEFYEKFPQIEKFVVIDTVISGRASWTILNEWEENGIEIGEKGEIEPILLVDEEGRKIKEEFRRYIQTCRCCQRIPRILTEDRGAALEGVVAVVYPQLILSAHEIRELYHQVYPLFGSWHSIPLKFQNTYLKIFNEFLSTIEAIINNNEDLEKLREDFLRDLSNTGVLSTRDSLVNGRDLDLPFTPSQTHETSARVIQVFYDESKFSSIIRAIKAKQAK